MAANNPLISVLMPVFNARRYLESAVQSILNQTLRDFEFIIINDGSTDGSEEMLRRFAKQDERIRLLSRPNTGYVVALNEGLSISSGEFIARMDADDIALPERFMRQIEFLRSRPDVVLLGSAVELIDGSGRLLLRPPVKTDEQVLQSDLLNGVSGIGHPTAMVRRAAMVAAGGYDVDTAPSEDLDLWLRLGETGGLANLSEPLLQYRLHVQSVSAQHRDAQVQKAALACERAWKRRGIEGKKFDHDRCWRPNPTDSKSRTYDFNVQYGWWAFSSAQRSTAMLYAWRAICVQPHRRAGWKLFLCSLLKPMLVVVTNRSGSTSR